MKTVLEFEGERLELMTTIPAKLPTANDLCEAGYEIPHDECPRCGATANDYCKLADELSLKEKRENVYAALHGLTQPH